MTAPHPPSPREAIHDVQARYCRGIDRRDRALVAECFHADATDDHGDGARSLDDFLDWCFNLLEGYDQTFHFLGQSTISFTSETRASVETYGIASHRTAGGGDHRNLTTGFRYLDEVTQHDGEWRISRRRAVTDWARRDPESEWWAVPAHYLQGAAGLDDPSYES